MRAWILSFVKDAGKLNADDLKNAGYLLKDKLYWIPSDVVHYQEKFQLISSVTNVFGKNNKR
jgi:hypothetical protein